VAKNKNTTYMEMEHGSKKKVIIASVLGIVILLIGAFFIGRISVKGQN
jgi:hypothetical protein